jgi:glucans biosynthesis protein
MERKTGEPESLRLTPRCGARRRDGLPCQKSRAKGRSRCQLHGGALGSGTPKGEAIGRYSHGLLTAEAIEERTAFAEMLARGIE